jgi:hypothetical protein
VFVKVYEDVDKICQGAHQLSPFTSVSGL